MLEKVFIEKIELKLILISLNKNENFTSLVFE